MLQKKAIKNGWVALIRALGHAAGGFVDTRKQENDKEKWTNFK